MSEPLVVNCFDEATRRYLLACVRRMHYDDALSNRVYRLEYRRPDEGHPHYLLVRVTNNEPVAVQYVRAATWLNEVQIRLSAYLTVIGFTGYNTERRPGGAMVKLSFEHNRLPHMFEKPKKRKIEFVTRVKRIAKISTEPAND